MLESVFTYFRIHLKIYKKVSSYTYFIPSPPQRKNGYREKEIDTITNYFLENNIHVIERQIKTISTEATSGAWVFFLLGHMNKESLNFNFEFDTQDLLNTSSPTSDLLENITYDE